MTKETWINHIKETENIIPPSQGGSKGDWQNALEIHKSMNCRECAARAKTRRANLQRKNRDDVYRSCGLTKVIGAVSGSTYWE
jgi:hypothetical protein